MRYLLSGAVLLCVVIISITGLRYDHGGRIARKPPIELFPDMDRQPKLRPQTRNNFFQDQLSSRLPVEGTVARSRPVVVDGKEVYAFEDQPVNTGRVPGTTNFVEIIPLPVTETMMARGAQRYNINCSPCHGAGGDGKGITSKYGMVAMANFHDARLVKMPDGEIFNTISYGKNLMGAYGPNVTVTDRWAIIAYIRALQRSRLATIDDVPANERLRLPPAPPPGAPSTNPPPGVPAPALKK